MRTTFLPFSVPCLGDEEIAEVTDSLRSGWITTGPKVKRFEEDFKTYVKARFAVPLSSATAGLHLSFLGLKLQPGDEVITTPMTFAATVAMIVQAGGCPVLADIEPGSLNLNVAEVEKKITSRTRAIVPVHFAGQPCDLDPLLALAQRHGLKVIEDAAHAVGTEYKGNRIGSFPTVSVFSFHPIKNITTGEGGMVCTDDEEFAEELSLMKFHGMNREAWKRYEATGTPNYDIVLPGFKYNMMDLQAALGIHQLRKLDDFIAKRTVLADYYNRELTALDTIIPPKPVSYPHRHAWHLYTPLVKVEHLTIDRDQFMAELKKRNIGSGLHFKAVHHHPWYRDYFKLPDGFLPVADYASDRILSLPLFPTMTLDDAADVVSAISDIVSTFRR